MDVMATPKPRMNRPPMKPARLWQLAWTQVPITIMRQPINIPHLRPESCQRLQVSWLSGIRKLTSEIGSGAGSKRANQVTNRINGVNDTCAGSTLGEREAEVTTILRVAVDSPHQGTIVTVNARIERCNEQNAVELSLSERLQQSSGDWESTNLEHSSCPRRQIRLHGGICQCNILYLANLSSLVAMFTLGVRDAHFGLLYIRHDVEGYRLGSGKAGQGCQERMLSCQPAL